jgi:hypothetical protein
MNFIGKENNEIKIQSNDLVVFNSKLKNENNINKIDIVFGNNSLSINYDDGSITNNLIEIVKNIDSNETPLSPKLFRRKTFVIGPHHDKITEKYFFGYKTKNGLEKYIMCDGTNIEIVNER